MMQLLPASRVSPEWWALYCTAFPPEERRSRKAHESALSDEHFHACSLHVDGHFVGLLTWWQWADLLYIEHLAIAEEKRGMGYGHDALALVQQKGLDIILEIEPVQDGLTARRLAFYQSCGFRELPFAHIQLAYQQGYPDIPLQLLIYSPHDSSFDQEKIYEFEALFTDGPMRYRDTSSSR